jgi:hypothetical protein
LVEIHLKPFAALKLTPLAMLCHPAEDIIGQVEIHLKPFAALKHDNLQRTRRECLSPCPVEIHLKPFAALKRDEAVLAKPGKGLLIR